MMADSEMEALGTVDLEAVTLALVPQRRTATGTLVVAVVTRGTLNPRLPLSVVEEDGEWPVACCDGHLLRLVIWRTAYCFRATPNTVGLWSQTVLYGLLLILRVGTKLGVVDDGK